ncbi:MAG: hypothetical protein CMK71_02990, partial [Pseudomonadaceae bacterium]|nr:hypothetical protein [Pseudomonadaceae bacterium]
RIAALRFDIHPPFIWRRLESACGFRHGDLMFGAGLVLILRWLNGLRRCASLSILRFIWRRLESACGFRHGDLMPDARFVLGLRTLDGLRRYASLSILRLSILRFIYVVVGIRLRLPTWQSHVWCGVGAGFAMA